MTQPEPNPGPSARMGFGWRAFFLLAAGVSVGVPVGSLVAAFIAPRNWLLGWCGIPFSALAVLLAVLNWGIALRYPFHLWKHGSREGFKYVSGFPVVGNGFAVLGAAIGWGDWWAAVPAVVAVLLDHGGFPWFLAVMVRTRQF